MKNDYEAVIGLEIHVELSTNSKMFCGCLNNPYDLNPNEATCPTCLGLPGALPSINRKAIMLGIRAALALNCKVADVCQFERKNYPYPDLVKGYQITQYEMPIGTNGYVTIYDSFGNDKRISIRRAHLEEDTAKLSHQTSTNGNSISMLDCNRSGVPLLEIVTEPELHTANDTELFLRQLRSILLYNGISRCRMERGEMRFEPNVSIRKKGDPNLGNRVEIKNQSSFRFVRDAIAYEIDRQRELLENGETVRQITCGWNPEKRQTFEQRSKEEAHDYRYFPDPDLPPVKVQEIWIEQQKNEMPESIYEFRELVIEAGVPPADMQMVIENGAVAFLHSCYELYPAGLVQIAKWLLRDIFSLINENNIPLEESKLSSSEFINTIVMLDEGNINAEGARKIIRELFCNGGISENIARDNSLSQINDIAALRSIIQEILSARSDLVSDYKSGKTKVRHALFGSVMKKTEGRANPESVNRLLSDELDK